MAHILARHLPTDMSQEITTAFPAPEVPAMTAVSRSDLTVICELILRLSRRQQFAAW